MKNNFTIPLGKIAGSGVVRKPDGTIKGSEKPEPKEKVSGNSDADKHRR